MKRFQMDYDPVMNANLIPHAVFLRLGVQGRFVVV